MAQVVDSMITARHDFNVCQRLPKTLRKPTPSQYRRNQEAVVMLALIAAAYMFVDELPKELEEAGIYRHNNKRVAQLERVVDNEIERVTKILKERNDYDT